MLQGIDDYHGDGVIAYDRVLAAGNKFVVHKASQGASLRDAAFESNWHHTKLLGLVTLSYHFFEMDVDGAAQANNLIAQLKAVRYDPHIDAPVAIDLEPNPLRPHAEQGLDQKTSIARVAHFVQPVEQFTGKQVLIYGSKDYLEQWLADAFSGHPLWLAQYTDAPAPSLPAAWKTWRFWQFAEYGTIPGIASHTADLDRFNGDEAALRAWIVKAKP